MQLKLSHEQVMDLAQRLNKVITAYYGDRLEDQFIPFYCIPRGGIPVGYLLLALNPQIIMVDEPEKAVFFVDDIIDSGDTMIRYCEENPGKPFFALVTKAIDLEFRDKWVIFPWEQTMENSLEDNIKRIIQSIGDDPERGGLVETPKRVAKAWQFYCSGYGKDVASVLKTFDDGAEHYDEMIIVKDIPFYSHCEHHMAPIFGSVTIGYIPNNRIVGLSKMSRVIEIFARRLQVQERLTQQIAEAIDEHLKPRGVGVLIKARHMCMESRGIQQNGHHTITSALLGVMKEDGSCRNEFMSLIR